MAKPAKKTSRPMMCFTCGEVTTLTLDDTKNEQYDTWAEQHAHNPDWARWTMKRKDPWYPGRKPL